TLATNARMRHPPWEWCNAKMGHPRENHQIGPFHVRVVGLPWLAPSQAPQSARREDEGEAPEPAERPECPDEEEAAGGLGDLAVMRSEEHTSELQSLRHLVCRLLLEKKKTYVMIVVEVVTASG